MSRLCARLSTVFYPKVGLILLMVVIGLVLAAALMPADTVWATPPQQGTVPPVTGRTRPAGIPEPATITLVGLGVGALAGYAWRRRKSNGEPPRE